MKLICRIFGHQPPVYRQKGWWSPGEQYMRPIVFATDNIGRVHAECRAECARCGNDFRVGFIHLNRTQQCEDAVIQASGRHDGSDQS